MLCLTVISTTDSCLLINTHSLNLIKIRKTTLRVTMLGLAIHINFFPYLRKSKLWIFWLWSFSLSTICQVFQIDSCLLKCYFSDCKRNLGLLWTIKIVWSALLRTCLAGCLIILKKKFILTRNSQAVSVKVFLRSFIRFLPWKWLSQHFTASYKQKPRFQL